MTITTTGTATTDTDAGGRLDAEVVVPVKWDDADPATEADFARNLERLARHADVTVVDGSRGPTAPARRARWSEHARVLAPDHRWGHDNGKVVGALTGIAASRHERVVIADDDVRYDGSTLGAVVRALHDADLVIPQNHPTSYPWWAWWESGRMLLNRAVAADWPGTCAVRRSTILRAGGWSSQALFENLEMARTVAAAGGRVAHRPDLLVARRPPASAHFLRQRVRQAYEDQAQPARLLVGLSVLPVTAALVRRPRLLVALAGAVVAVAESGRRRSGGRRVFPPHTTLAAPLWLLERGACAWLALGVRLRGGPVYHGRRMPLAAHSTRWLEAQLSGGRTSPLRRMGLPGGGRRGHHIRTSPGGEMTSTARDVMTEGAECVSENDTVVTAAQRMASLDVGALPICGDDDRLKGMLTDRDIVINVVAQGQDPEQVTVGSLAEGGEVVTIGADDSLDEARRTMERHQVRRLPVIDGHRLVGMVSQGDLSQALPDEDTGRLVEQISEP